MRVVLALHPDAAADPAARWTAETVGRLLGVPWSAVVDGGSPLDSGIAAVHVGPPGTAPDGAAVALPWTPGLSWKPDALEIARFDDVPWMAPPGAETRGTGPSTAPALLLRSIFSVLSREEERLVAARDRWGCFAGTQSRLQTLGMLELASVNRLAGWIERGLHAFARARGAVLPELPRWPGGRRFACVLSHDVDELRRVSARESLRLLALARDPRGYAARAGLAGMARAILRRGGADDDPYWNLERWVRAEEERGFRSTFYVCTSRWNERHEYDATYRLGDSIRFDGRRTTVAAAFGAIAARGFEVGLHGSYESHLDAAALAAQRSALELATGTAVRSTRQHYLRLDVPRTWRAQQEAGFNVDSTLGYNEAYGFRAGIAAPFHPWDDARASALELLELPLTLMDGVLFRTFGLEASEAARRVRLHLDEVESVGGLAVLLWHPNAAAAEFYPGWWDAWVAALDRLAERGAWATSAEEIRRWWVERGRAQRFLPP